MAKSKPTDNEHLNRALNEVRDFLRQGRRPGADIGNELRRRMPDFSPSSVGYPSLSRLLFDAADDLVVVGQSGNDRIWALGESVSDQEMEHALGAEAEPGDEPVSTAQSPVTRVEYVGFRSCHHVRLSLETSGVTVLVGPNASGKSSLLHGISYVSQVTRGKLRALFSGPRDVRRLRSADATGPMELAIFAGSKELRVQAEPGDDDTKLTVRLKSGKKVESWTSPGDPPNPPLPHRPESRLFWPSVLLKFRSEALSAPSSMVEGEPRLSFDGAGLPTVLAYLATNEPKRLQEIVERVRAIVPGVEGTRQTVRRWEPTANDVGGERAISTYQYRLDVKMKGAGWIAADLLSEGTLFAFGIHAVLAQRVPPRILLMDDIDRGLHPKAQRTLIQQLKQICLSGGPQIVLSTHSPYILDELPAESVRVVRCDDGRTQVRALVEHPEWQEWKESMTSGEFWTYVGEDWLEKAR